MSVPKKSRPAIPNDFRPVALTSHVMKSFEKLIKTMIMSRTDHLLDPRSYLSLYPSRVLQTDTILYAWGALKGHT